MPTSDAVDKAFQRQIDDDEQERLEAFKRRWEAYFGDHPDSIRGEKDNTKLNKSRAIVDKGISFLLGDDDEAVQFQLPETAPEESQTWLDECWDENGGLIKLKEYAQNGAVCGHACMRLHAPETHPLLDFPKMTVLDPAWVTPFWDPQDYTDIWRWRIEFIAIDRDGKPRAYRQEIDKMANADGESWRIAYQSSSTPRGTDFRTYRVEDWPYPFSPIVHNQNLILSNEFWGLSDLEDDVIDLNFDLNFVASNLKKLVRLYAHPKVYGRGLSRGRGRRQEAVSATDAPVEVGGAIDWSADRIIELHGQDAELGVLELKADIEASGGLFDRLERVFHEITRTPNVAPDKIEGLGPMAGVALRILYAPLLEKTGDKRLTYGRGFIDLNRRLLHLGMELDYREPDSKVTILWPEPLPVDPAVERQVALLDQQLGVSSATTLDKLGYDAERELAQKAEEQDEALERAQKAMEKDPMNVPPGSPRPGVGAEA